MKDWQGNEVKVGDIVVTVQVRETFSFYSSSVGYIGPDGKMKLTPIPQPDPIENMWEVIREEKVFEYESEFNGKQYKHIMRKHVNMDGSIWNLPLDDPFAMNDEPDPNPSYIMCIKGKSDDRDAFYINKFKA